jgi:hypothetical protein
MPISTVKAEFDSSKHPLHPTIRLMHAIHAEITFMNKFDHVI